MRRLIQLIDTMRDFGYVVAVPGTDREGMPQISIEQPRPIEWNIFERVQPFVFANHGATDITFRAKQIQRDWREGLDDPKIDAPFPVFSIEHVDGEALDFFTTPDGERRETLCIIVVEVEPKQYGYYALTQDKDAPFDRPVAWKSNAETSTVEAFMDRIEREQVGTELIKQKIRLGTGKLKREHKIRRLIHVRPRREASSYEGMRQIDWSHRWEVRGHWRKHEGLGKDRDGQYSVNGFTWVVHHEKGPEHLPLIKKVRVVE